MLYKFEVSTHLQVPLEENPKSNKIKILIMPSV